MVKFRKRVEFAISMLGLISEADGEIVSVKAMTKVIPRSYQVRIAKSLLKAKIIKAKEGRNGGYTLARDAKDITLKDISEAIDGKNDFKNKLMNKVSGEIDQVLGQYTI